MKRSTIVCFALFLLGVLLFLAQMWFHIWSIDIYSKIMVTNLAALVISIVFVFLVRENREDDKRNGENHLK